MRFLFLSSVLFFTFYTTTVIAQQNHVVVTGKVVDQLSLAPLEGVTIVSGTELGVRTDSTGFFTIKVPLNSTLTFSFAEYKPTTYKASGSIQDITIYMQSDENKIRLSDVVVVGFSKKKREVATGASTLITAEDIKDVPAANVTELLQGRVAGVNIQMTSGMPGSRGSVFQRGLSNLNVSGDGSNAFLAVAQPLIIIDGIPIDVNNDYEYGFTQAGPEVNPLSLIPAEDIESFEILKDAAATANYGSRGAYGVWIINTKRGRSPRPQINYSTNVYYSMVPQLRDVYGGRMERAMKINQILQYYPGGDYEAWKLVNGISVLSDSLNPYLNNSVNWQAYFFRPTVNQTHNLNFSGGDPKFNYKINLGYLDETGIIRNTGMRRYNLSLNSQYVPSERFTLMASIMAANSANRMGSGVGVLQQGVASSGMASTILPPPNIYTENQGALAAFNLDNDNGINSVKSSLQMQISLAKNLVLDLTGTHDYTVSDNNTFYPSWLNSESAYGLITYNDARSQYNTYNKVFNNYYNRNVLRYTKSFKEDKHTLGGYIFTDLSATKSTISDMRLYGAPNNFISGPIGYNLGKSVFGAMAPVNQRIFGYGASISYNYLKKYIIDLNYRLDGTSTNGPLSGFRQNPVIGLKWNFSKERLFDKTSRWLDFGDLRLSWGKNIQPQGTVYDVFGRYTPYTDYLGDGTVVLNYNTAPNLYFLPNTKTELNFGGDLSFYKGRISLVYDAYYRSIENLSKRISIPAETGFQLQSSNDFGMVNYGHELALTLKPISTSDFKWSLSINGAYNKNVLTQLPEGIRQDIYASETDPYKLPVIYRLGRSSLGNFLYNTKGVYSKNADVPIDPATGLKQRINGQYLVAGDPIFADIDGNYIINDFDRVAVGDPQPQLTGGLFNSFSYKDFSLSFSASYTFLRDVINMPLAGRFRYFYNPDQSVIGQTRALVPLDQYNYWQNPGDQATYPSPYNYDHARKIDAFRYNQTLFMEDGSYFKINYVTLSYNLKKQLLSRIGIKSSRVFITGQNLLVISNYSGPNPENVSDLGRESPDAYPNPRKLGIGLNVTF